MFGLIVRNKTIAVGTLTAIATLCAMPPSAEAQLFGGRLRARREANRIERQERLDRLESERLDRLPPDVARRRDDRGPVIVLPRDSEPSYLPPVDSRADLRDAAPAYRYRSPSTNDYGAGFGARLRDVAREFLDRAGPAVDSDRQSVLRPPAPRDDRDLRATDSLSEPTNRRERTVRVDHLDDPARIDPPEDRFEPVTRDRARSSRPTTREPRDSNPPRPPLPAVDNIDDRVEPASATDDFDKPRSARSESSADAPSDKPRSSSEKPPAKPKSIHDDEAELLPPPPPKPME